MRTLRTRLILSHILPLLVIIPVIGIILIYILETQVVLASLSDELVRQANLTAEIAYDQPAIWEDTVVAQLFVTRFSAQYQSQMMLLDPFGRLLASSNPDDLIRLGEPLPLPNLAEARQGKGTVHINYSRSLQTEIAEVIVPVVNAEGQVIGIIRLTHQLSKVYGRFLNLRYIVAAVLATGLLLGVAVGLVLALDLERSLRRVTEAIYGITRGRQWTTLPERGPEEIRLLLRAFNTLIERLRMLEQARQRLLANLVHEVGRPMGALQSAIQALLNGADRDSGLRQELLLGMQAEVQRLYPLLNNLAELHGQVLGTLELNSRPISLSDWLPLTLSSWREAAQAKGLQWQANLSPALPMLEVDPDRLAQVIGNLLSNAVKYTPAGGTLTVSVGVETKGVWICIADTGPGIASEEQTRIFEPFYRSQPDRRFPQGMGLGLTIARDLIVAHGGHLEVESAPGQGSRFTIWLPPQLIIRRSDVVGETQMLPF